MGLEAFNLSKKPHRMAQLQTILNVPFKRGAREAPIEYFDSKEPDALFQKH
jgi:integrase/recombinase XerD